ncbi:MAG: BatA and WFA domain-containing protein [Phycisphaerae bacterium]|nr:BatA and WFA domain-containing protein [Phycisphaerae bacterium]
MSFLHPGYLLALVGLIPLAALYWLKVRPKRHTVTALFLWQAVLAEKRQSALFHRLRDLWSLVMMVLAFVWVVLSMAGPELGPDARRDVLLILDTSASMQALEADGSRLDTAKEVAVGIIRGLNGRQQAAVASVSTDVQYTCHFTSSPKALTEAIRAIEPSDCPLRPGALSALAAGGARLDRCRIVLISDGCSFTPDANDGIELLKVGSDRDNLGFVACDLRQIEGSPVRVGLFFQLASCFDKEVRTDVLVTAGPDGRLIKVIPVTVKPGVNKPEVHTITGGGPGPWTVVLDMQDALARDNTVYLALQPRRPVKVKVEPQDDFFMVNSVMAFARTSGDLQVSTDQPDVVLAHGVIPEARRSILFGIPEGASWCGRAGKETHEVVARIRLADHPVLRDCSMEGTPFVGARQVSLPPDSLVLVETVEQVPLIYKVTDGQRTAVVINMDVAASEFHYSAWFPVLVYRCSRFLMGEEDRLESVYATGESVLVPGDDDGRGPLTAGGQESPPPAPLIGSVYGPILRAGVHKLQGRTQEWLLGASLLAPSETLLKNRGVQDTHQPISRGRSLSMPLAMAALVLLVAECMLYHRRKVG